MIIHNASFCYTSNVLCIILSEVISISRHSDRKAASPDRHSRSRSPEDTSKSAKQVKVAKKAKESQHTQETEDLDTSPTCM